MDMPDVTPFPEWVSCVNFPNMVKLAQKGRTARRFLLTTLKRSNPLRLQLKMVQSFLSLIGFPSPESVN